MQGFIFPSHDERWWVRSKISIQKQLGHYGICFVKYSFGKMNSHKCELDFMIYKLIQREVLAISLEPQTKFTV